MMRYHQILFDVSVRNECTMQHVYKEYTHDKCLIHFSVLRTALFPIVLPS